MSSGSDGGTGSDAGAVPLPAGEVLRVLFERAPEIITIVDDRSRQQMVNAAGLRLLGFDESFRTPADGWSWVHPDDRERLAGHRDLLDRLAVDGTGVDRAPPVRYRVRAGTGEWRWLETVTADMSDVEGVAGRVGFSRDVTDAEERARALVESEARLAAVVSCFPDGALVASVDGEVLLANDRVGERFGLRLPGASLVGRPVDEVVATLRAGLVDPTALGAPPEPDGAPAELEVTGGRHVALEVVAVRDGDAERGRLWLVRDATARRDEQRRSQALLELEQRARQAAELHAEQLEAYDRLRNDFLASVSHELRTPLTAIASASELLAASPEALPPEAAAHLDIIRRNADRLVGMVEDLLLVGRLDAGELHLERQPLRLGPLLADTVAAAAPLAARRDVTVRVEVAGDPVVDADARRLQQVVANLLDNAVKFTAPGTTVTVAARRLEPIDDGGIAGADVELTVTDRGSGIAPTDRRRVFERFVRAPEADRSAAPGSGLGLAIVRGLVELHGGTVELLDAAGGGTVARCTLPAGGGR